MRKEELEKLHFTEDIIHKIKTWNEHLNRGSFANAKDVTDSYNYVFSDIRTKANYTSCMACIRGRIKTLIDTLNEWEKYQESLKPQVEEVVPIAGTTENHIAVEEPKPKKTKTKKDAKE